MPAALERKLKREVSSKDWSKDKKDAYIYGTLRKTGWKPSREKRMSELNADLNTILFDSDDDDDNKKSALGTAAKLGTLAGVGAAGALGHQAIQSTGGYGANFAGAKLGYKLAGTTGNYLPNTLGARAGLMAGTASNYGKTLLAKIRGMIPKFSSKEETIQFDEKILEPWGDMPKSKISQEEFPAGMSPAAVLKFPFPKLMRYLHGTSMYQQQFSRKEKLVNLGSRLDGILNFDEPQDNAFVPRYLVGSPIVSAIKARRGQKIKAFAHQTGHGIYESGKGIGVGAAVGAGIGALSAIKRPGEALSRAAVGAGVGGYAGGIAGALKGNFDKRSTEIMRKYQ